MAEISFRVKTDWQEVEKLVGEIDTLNKTISSVNTDLPRSEIDKLTNKLTTLKEKYSEIITFAARSNAEITDLFGKRGGVGSSLTKDMTQGAVEDMQKMQSSIAGVFDAIQGKVEEFKKNISDAFSVVSEIKVDNASVGVLDTMIEKMSQLSRETERQKILLSEQASQNTILLQQQQQESASLSSQSVQHQGLVDDVTERISKESEVSETIDRATDSVKKQTEEYQKQTEVILENKNAKESSVTPIDASVDETHRTEELARLREQEKKYNDMVANAPTGSEEQQKALSLLQGVQERIKQLENGEVELTNAINNEAEARNAVNQKIQEQYAYLDEVVKRHKDGTLSEKEYLDAVQKVNQEIEERKTKIRDLEDKQQSVSGIETKYDKNYNVVNADEINKATQLYKEYGQQVDEETARVEKLKQALSQLTNTQKQQADDAKREVAEVSDSTQKAFQIFERKDEFGKAFDVIAKNAEEADEKIEQTKDSLEVYPQLLERIKKKAEDMRTNAYMTKEGENLVKQAGNIGRALDGRTLSTSFQNGGIADTLNKVNELSDIEQKLDDINREQKEIEAENQKIAEAEEKARLEAEEHAKSSMHLRTQLMNAREEMARLVKEGKQGTPEFQALARKAGEMRDQMQKASAVMNYYSDNQRYLHALKTGLQGVAGAASLATGVVGLFNEDSKKMAEIQTKVQSILGIVIGLETTYNLVKQESFIRLAAEEVWTWMVAKARGAQAAATTAATAAQEGLNVAMAKNPIGAVIVLLMTLGAAIWAVTKALSGQTEAEKKAKEEREKHIKAIKEQNKQWASSVASSAAKQITTYNELEKKWNELGNNIEKKRKFIKNSQSAFHSLGFAVNSVTDAEKLFAANTDAVVNAIMARAKAEAYGEMMKKNLQEKIEKDMQVQADNKVVKKKKYKKDTAVSEKEAKELNGEGLKPIDVYTNGKKTGVRYVVDDADAANRKAAENAIKKRNEKVKKENKKNQDEYDRRNKEYEKGLKKSLEDQKKYNKTIGVKEWTGESKKNKTSTKENEEQKRKELFDKQKREQTRAAIDLEFSTREARIKAMEDSTKKTLAQINLDHDKQIEAIKRSYEDMRIKRIEEAKKLWESDNKNKGKNFYNSDEYKKALESPMRKTLTKDDSALINVQHQEKAILAELGKGEIMNAIQEQFGKGNVDVLARPLVDAIELTKKGWKDAGDGYATVFSSSYGVLDKEGKKHEILVTPILPDGTVLSQKELEDYISNVLEGSDDILKADSKGIVIGVDVESDAGEKLHQLHEQLYNIPSEKTIEIKTLYDNATDAERENYIARTNAAEKQLEENRKKIRQQQIQAMNEYLKEYGNKEQQKLAITQEYEEKIKKLTNPYEIAAARAKEREEQEKVDQGNWKEDIDWEGIFSSLEGHTKEYLYGLKEQLQGLLSSGKITDLKDMEVIQNKITDINELISKEGGLFSFIGPLQLEYNRRLEHEANARKLLETAQTQESEAKTSYDTSMDTLRGKVQEVPDLEDLGWDGESLSELNSLLDHESEAYRILFPYIADAIDKENELRDARKKTAKATSDVKNAEDGKKESAKDKWERTRENIENSKAYKNVSEVPGLLNNMGLGDVAEKAQKGLDGFNDGMGAVTDFMSGNYVGALTKGISAVSNFGEALGAWSNSNRAEVERENAKLQIAMDVNTEAINRNTEAIKNSSPIEALEKYQQARRSMESSEFAARRQMENNAYMYDGGHSLNYDLDTGGGVIPAIVDYVRRKNPNFWLNGANDIGGLLRSMSAADWNSLYDDDYGQSLLTRLGEEIANAQDDGNYNGLFADIINFANAYSPEKYEELLNTLRESITGISFDSLYDNFKSNIMDMNKSAKDFSNDFESYLRTAIYNALIADTIKEKLQSWYGAFASFVSNREKGSNGKVLTNNEINLLMKSGGSYVDEDGVTRSFESIEQLNKTALNLRDSIESLGLYGGSGYSQQDAAHASITSITYDQADSLIGIEMAKQIILEQMLKIMRNGGVVVDGISDDNTSSLDQYIVASMTNEKLDAIIGQIQNISAENVSNLGDIIILVKDILKKNGAEIDMSKIDSAIFTNSRNEYIDDAIKKKFRINEENQRYYGWKDIEDIYEAAIYPYGFGNTVAREYLKGYDLSSYETFLAQLNKEFGGQFDALYNTGREDTTGGMDVAVEVSLLTARAENILAVTTQTRDIAADSRDILAGMAIHVEEIRDGVVDTIVPRIKNIDDNLNRVYKIVENQ